MPFRRQISNQPPSVEDLQKWESEGWTIVSMLGPVLAQKQKTDDDAEPEGEVVFVTYMRHPGPGMDQSRIVSASGVRFRKPVGNRATRRGRSQ